MSKRKKAIDPAVRVKELRELIRRHEHAYYVLDQPEVSDAEYDALFLDLRRIDVGNSRGVEAIDDMARHRQALSERLRQTSSGGYRPT